MRGIAWFGSGSKRLDAHPGGESFADSGNVTVTVPFAFAAAR
jgi:hypothetical protein